MKAREPGASPGAQFVAGLLVAVVAACLTAVFIIAIAEGAQ